MQSQKTVDYDDPRSKLVYSDDVTMNHIVALKQDRGTGANILIATTDTGALGMYALQGPNVIPLAASAPIVTPGVTGHSEMIRCATLCNNFVITGAEDSRVCSWTTKELQATAPASSVSAPVQGQSVASPAAAAPYRPDHASSRKHRGGALSPY